MNPEFQYSRSFKSSLDEVDAQVTSLIATLDKKYEKYNRFVIDLVLRETLNNAVIHGNKHNPELQVSFSFTIINAEIMITVEDQGSGFDWRSIIKSHSSPENDHGRGFPILSSYCHDVHLNQVGNRITFRLNQNQASSG